MKKFLTTLVILTNLILPLRFGLAELSRADSLHHGRRVELAKRLKQAGQISEIHARKVANRITGVDKKLVRRPLYTPGEAVQIPRNDSFCIQACGNAKPSEEISDFYHLTPTHLLRAPPALA